MRTSIAFVIFSIVQIGCGSSYIVSSIPAHPDISFSEFNDETKDRSTTIVFHNGSPLDCKEVHSESDSTTWLDPITGARVAVPTHVIKRIFFTSGGRGALEGAGIGFLAGAGAGLLAAVISNPSPGGGAGLGEIVYIVYPAIGGVAGLLVGVIVGGVTGHTYNYEFQSTEQSDSLQNRK